MDSSEFIWVPDLYGVHYHRYLLSDCFGSLMIGKRLKGREEEFKRWVSLSRIPFSQGFWFKTSVPGQLFDDSQAYECVRIKFHLDFLLAFFWHQKG